MQIVIAGQIYVAGNRCAAVRPMPGDDIHRLASHVDDGCTSDPHGPYGFAAGLALVEQPSWAQGRSLPHRIRIVSVVSVEGVDLIRRRRGEEQILRSTWCA